MEDNDNNYQFVERLRRSVEISRDNVDLEKMIFDMIERRAPELAERLLDLAARQATPSELMTQLQVMIEDELSEDVYETALMGLEYARRYLSAPATGH